MKKALLLLASAAMLLVGCAKEKLGPDAGSGEMVTATFTAHMQSAPQTKAVTDGEGTKANRCVMEIYYKGVLYTRDVKPISSMKTTFTPKLVSNRTYDVLFWADCGGENLADKYYKTNAEGLGLQAVEMKATAYAANDDARDAFFTKEEVEVLQQVSTEEFELTRPFAQVNIITTDAAIIKNANLYPDGVKMVYTAPTKFNLLSGELSEAKVLTVTGAPYETFNASSAAITLEMDYLFAGLEKSALDIAFEASKTGESAVTSHSFTNIPVQRNYRTNIKGALLTTTGDWTATIVPGWNQPDEEVKYVEEGSIEAANQALADGKTAILIKSPADAADPIVIPAVADGKNISIKTEGTNGKTLTFNGATGPANLYIASDAKELVINTPKTHVEVNSGAYTKVTAETSATTLVIAKGVTVETLEVNKGNVEIHGVVNAISRKNGVKAEMYASDRATLINYINWAKTGDIAGLECDIVLNPEENWTPVDLGSNTTFDGCGYSIENMTVEMDASASTPYGGGFFQNMNGTMKNVTFINADVKSTEAGKGNVFGIAAGYAYGNVTFENIKVQGSKVSAFGKVGGILGMAADPGTSVTTMKNCSLEDVEITGTYNVANYIGLLQNNVAMTGCSSSNVRKELSVRYGEDSYVTFDNVKVINNDTENPKYVLSSGKYWKYVSGSNIYYYSAFADCYNDIHYDGWKALDGTVDGLVFNTPETPQPIDLEPVATIGTTKYYDLPSALAALQQGETLEIWQAGEYAVQTLSAPSNSIIEAKVDGVVFNHTPKSGANNNWVSAQTENVKTVKNITWNVGNGGGYPYFSNTNLENCTVNGMLCTHLTNKFKDCTFVNEEGYNFWVYGNVYTEFDNCTFTCPGKNDGAAGCGSALNCYNERAQTPTPVLVVKNCTFTAKEASNKYSAIYVKPETAFDIRISNSTCNDKFCTGAISGSKLWNLKSDREGTTVTIDDVMVYPFCSKDSEGNYHIVNADGLLQFHDLYAAGGKVASTAKVFIENDIDFTGKTWTVCDWHADSNIKGFALFDGQNHTIKNFTVNGQGMFSRWAGGATPYFKDIVFDGAKNVTSTLNVSLFCGQVYQNAKIENVTIKNSQIEGTYKVAPFVGTVFNENPGSTATLTLKDCKVENTTVRSTKYNYCTCGMVAWVSDIDDNDKIVFEGNNVVKDVTLYKSAVSYNLFGKIYWGDGGSDGVAHDEAENVTVTNVNIVNVQ